LNFDETKDLINYRLLQAGYHGSGLFKDEAIRLIHAHTRGYPRQLSILCHNLLEMLVMQERSVIDESLVREALAEELRPVSGVAETRSIVY
jgi:type II secretory pathway predicted ATPase ExeA